MIVVFEESGVVNVDKHNFTVVITNYKVSFMDARTIHVCLHKETVA